MKKIFFISFILLAFTSNISFADNRISTTVTAYNSSGITETVVKRGDARVYSVSFVASSAGGQFLLLDAVSNTSRTSFADIKAEGKEATTLDSQFQDFSEMPLEFSTGLTIVVINGTLILRYE